MPANDPLYFLHIPKTAGVSFRTLLESRYRPRDICPVYNPRDLFTAPTGSLNGYLLYRAHLGFTLPTHVSRPLRIVTLLRNPVALIVSMYHFFRRWTPHPLHAVIHEQRLGLDDFVYHDACVPYLWNPQTYHLAYQDRSWTPHAIKLELGTSVDRIRQRREAVEAFKGEPTAELVELACRRLEQMTFVGLADRLIESVALLCHILGWKPFAEVPRLNVSPDAIPREQLSPSTRSRIEELTHLDAEVHDHACRLFERAVSKLQVAGACN